MGMPQFLEGLSRRMLLFSSEHFSNWLRCLELWQPFCDHEDSLSEEQSTYPTDDGRAERWEEPGSLLSPVH